MERTRKISVPTACVQVPRDSYGTVETDYTRDDGKQTAQVHKDSLDNNEDLNYICTNEIIFKVMS